MPGVAMTASPVRHRTATALVLALALGAGLGACGGADEAAVSRTVTTPTEAIALKVRSDDGAGHRTSGTLTCRENVRRAGGALRDRAAAARLCAHARAIATLLTTQPPAGRICTEIYGGPQTARVTGTIDGDRVDRRFTRRNGCEIADYDRAGLLLPR